MKKRRSYWLFLSLVFLMSQSEFAFAQPSTRAESSAKTERDIWGLTVEDWRLLSPQLLFEKAGGEAKFDEFRKAETENDPKGTFLTGLAYYLGKGVSRDLRKAFLTIEQASKIGNNKSYFVLAVMTFNGDGTEKSAINALTLATKGAEDGDTNAMLFVAQFYINGIVVAKDRKKALEWHQKAADSGDSEGKIELALANAYGELLEKNENVAVQLLAEAQTAGATSDELAAATLAIAISMSIDNNFRQTKSDEGRRWLSRTANYGGTAGTEASKMLFSIYKVECVKTGNTYQCLD